MKLIIDIDDEYFVQIKNDTVGSMVRAVYAIRNGIPYDKVIDEVTELLENEWGYEGMKDDVSRIMRGGAEE